MDERVSRVDESLQPLRLRMVDIRAALLDEYLELKEKLGPLEKRLEDVRDRLRDLVTEEGHFVDELQAAFPRLGACVRPSVDVAQLEACLRAGMVTDGELERAGVLTRALHSRALVVKALGQQNLRRPGRPVTAEGRSDLP